MWGLFAGEARKQPPHIPFSTAIPKTRIFLYKSENEGAIQLFLNSPFVIHFNNGLGGSS